MTHQSVRVDANHGAYRVEIGDGVLALLAERVPDARRAFLVTDATVDALYGAGVRAALGLGDDDAFVIAPGEAAKSLDTAARIYAQLAARRVPRDGVIVALGGGVVGDLAGFVAATWMRGVDVIQLPTTLLAMVDSSVGGKTAVNLAEGKNLVGAFHPPSAVLADVATLATLPDRELSAGLAEVLKYGAIVDADFFSWIDAHSAQLLARQTRALTDAVERSVAHKAAIVARDEFETGDRALLNFGHTFGHALETLGHYRRWLHGEAVAIGMVCAAVLSARLGLAPAADAERLADILERLGLPTSVPCDCDAASIIAAMALDKKATADGLRLVLWRGVGRAEIVSGVDLLDIAAAIGDLQLGTR